MLLRTSSSSHGHCAGVASRRVAVQSLCSLAPAPATKDAGIGSLYSLRMYVGTQQTEGARIAPAWSLTAYDAPPLLHEPMWLYSAWTCMDIRMNAVTFGIHFGKLGLD